MSTSAIVVDFVNELERNMEYGIFVDGVWKTQKRMEETEKHARYRCAALLSQTNKARTTYLQ